jgi:hypothetical protein
MINVILSIGTAEQITNEAEDIPIRLFGSLFCAREKNRSKTRISPKN